jgi:hypothetical protein
MFRHRGGVTDPKQAGAELLGWLRAAYANA